MSRGPYRRKEYSRPMPKPSQREQALTHSGYAPLNFEDRFALGLVIGEAMFSGSELPTLQTFIRRPFTKGK